jgi:uncharacterized membrane protein
MKEVRLAVHKEAISSKDEWFSQKAEAFARFFGTPFFIVLQTLIVFVWIGLNVIGITHFDLYPFILLNLAFSTQAAYAAPLILLAQTKQADRDKSHSIADAEHREDIAHAQEVHNNLISKYIAQLIELQEMTKKLVEKVEVLTIEVHSKIVQKES